MKLIILDRDGVINRDSTAFIKTPDEWKPLPGSLEAISRLHHNGYTIVVASNQSGVGRGLFDYAALSEINRKMHLAAQAEGGEITAIFFCPHTEDDACTCRKPKSGLFEQIRTRFDVELDDVPAIGDSMRDLEAATTAGAIPILVRTGNGKKTEKLLGEGTGIEVFDDLASTVQALLD